MKTIERINLAEDARRVKVLRRGTNDDFQIYGDVRYITVEVDDQITYYRVLHHGSGETSTFATADWRVMVERFVDL